jgi:hypothetical protein
MFVETLGQAKEEAYKAVDQNQAVLTNPEFFDEWLMFGGMSYGETARKSFELDSVKGKGTRSGFHAVIWRHDQTGRYEVVAYVS